MAQGPQQGNGSGSNANQSQKTATEAAVEKFYNLGEKVIELYSSIASDVAKVTAFNDRITFEVKKDTPFAEGAYRLQSNEEDMTAGTLVRAFTLDTNTGKYREFTENEYVEAFAPVPDGELRTFRPEEFAAGVERSEEQTAPRRHFTIGDTIEGEIRGAVSITFETEYFALHVPNTKQLVDRLPGYLSVTLDSLSTLPPVPDED
jgi:hypothetical protein